VKYVRGFFAFWYDFIVGDAWEVAAGVVAALVFIGVLIHSNQDLAEVLGFVFVAAVVGIVGISLWRE